MPQNGYTPQSHCGFSIVQSALKQFLPRSCSSDSRNALQSFDVILLTGFGASQCLNIFAATWQHGCAANLVIFFRENLISTFQTPVFFLLEPELKLQLLARWQWLQWSNFSFWSFLILFDPFFSDIRKRGRLLIDPLICARTPLLYELRHDLHLHAQIRYDWAGLHRIVLDSVGTPGFSCCHGQGFLLFAPHARSWCFESEGAIGKDI